MEISRILKKSDPNFYYKLEDVLFLYVDLDTVITQDIISPIAKTVIEQVKTHSKRVEKMYKTTLETSGEDV